MNGTVIQEHLDEIMSYVRETASFAQEQAPLVAQEIVRAEMISSAIWTIGAGLIAAVLFRYFRQTNRRFLQMIEEAKTKGYFPAAQVSEIEEASDFAFRRLFCFCFGSLLVMPALLSSVYDLLRCFVAPRVVVLEYLRRFMLD